MAGARRLLSKYWILIVILLWVIAWANRDWLASNEPPALDVPAEESDVRGAAVTEIAQPAVPAAPSAPAEADAPVEASARAEADVAAEASVPAEADVAAEASAPAEANVAAKAHAPAEAHAPVQPRASAEPTAESLQAASPPESAPALAPRGPAAATGDQQAEPTGPAQQTGARVAELLAHARTAQWQRGPRAAAEWLIAGLGDISVDAPERADLYGEIGNLHLSMGQFQEALAAYDLALVVLPAAERAEMVRRLGPIYDRYHPSGRSYLEQFR